MQDRDKNKVVAASYQAQQEQGISKDIMTSQNIQEEAQQEEMYSESKIIDKDESDFEHKYRELNKKEKRNQERTGDIVDKSTKKKNPLSSLELRIEGGNNSPTQNQLPSATFNVSPIKLVGNKVVRQFTQNDEKQQIQTLQQNSNFAESQRLSSFKKGQGGTSKGVLSKQALTQQKTIPLNFVEDMKNGFESEDKNLFEYQNNGQEGEEQWFQEHSYSAIQRNLNGKDRGQFDEMSIPDLSEKISKQKSLRKVKAQDSIESNDKRKSPQDNNINDYNSESNLLNQQTEAQNQNHLDTEVEQQVNGGEDLLKEHQLTENNQQHHKGASQSIIKLKPSQSGTSPRLKELTLHFTPGIKGDENHVQLRRTDKMVTVEENACDISDIYKRFDIDYHGKQTLDDKRSRMLIINNLMAAKYQGEVKDDEFFMIVDKTQMEQIDDFTGRCIKLRQVVWRFKAHVTGLALYIISQKAFDGVSLFFIGMNSVQLAISDPTDLNPPPIWNYVDNTFLVFYTFEMCLKILGWGFVLKPGSYLRDPWNMLDFVIVFTGLLDLITQGGSVDLSAMRTFRVMRPLKTISGIEGLRIIVSSLLKSSKPLFESLIVLFFGYLLFSIVGLLLFQGIMKKQCVSIETGQTYMNPNEFYTCGGYQGCPDGYFCGKTNSNPNYEQTNFDNIFYSFITVYQCVSLEGWTNDMKWIQNAYTLTAWFFFCPMTFIMSFFLMQLTQAVISSKFAEEHEKGKSTHVNKKTKQKKLHDFDHLNEQEKKRMLDDQQKSRQVILRKWKQIFFLKQQMRIMIRHFQEKKRQENYQKHLARQKQILAQYGENGFSGLTLKEQIDYGSILGYKQMNSIEGESSSRHLLQSVRGPDVQPTHKEAEVHETITEDENEENNSNTFKKLKNSINKNKDIQGIKRIKKDNKVAAIDNPRPLNLEGIQGLQNNLNFNPNRLERQNSPSRNNISINENFFTKFINAELHQIEAQFSDNQLRDMVINMNGGQKFLNELDQNIEQEMNSFSHVSYTSLENGQINNRHHHQLVKEAISEDSEKQDDIISMTNFTQNKIQKQSTKNMNSNSEDQSQITEEIIKRDNQKVPSNKNDKTKVSTKTVNTSKNVVLGKDKDTPELINNDSKEKAKDWAKDPKKENQSLTTTLQPNEKTSINVGNVSEKKLIKMVKTGTIDQQTADTRIKKKFIGTGSIFQRDFIPVDKSYLNNKFLVEGDIGNNKKIYVRKDKIDYMRPAEDIFEFRERQKREKLEEELKQESMDYLANIRIKAYQRKCKMDHFHIVPSDDQKDMLQTNQLDLYDVEKTLQKQYNRAFLSPLYVTGTLSVVIQGKMSNDNENSNHQTMKVRKLQQILDVEEKENPFLMYVVKSYMPNNFYSRSFLKNISLQANEVTLGQSSYYQSQSMMGKGGALKAMQSGFNRAATMKSGLGTNKSFAKKGGGDLMQFGDSVTNAQKKEMQLMKKAKKDANLQKKLMMQKINKDAYRSTNFRQIVIRRRTNRVASGLGGSTNILDQSDLKDSDDEEENNNKIDDDEDEIVDDFFLDFDCKTEIFRSKKKALQKKVSKVQWSGQDVLAEFDPLEATRTILYFDDIRIWPKGKVRLLKFIQVHSKTFVMGTLMDNLMTICVAINTVCLAIDRYGIDPETEAFLNTANDIFTYIFLVEMCLKLIGLGVIKYLKDTLNYLDGTIVILSMVEVILQGGGGSLSAFKSIRIFRTFRVLRITRLLRAMKDMTSILSALYRSISSLMYLFLLMFLFIFIFALLGMQIYGGRLDFVDNADGFPGVPRQNYNSFFWAYQVAFQLMTQENWQNVLWDTLRTPMVNQGLTMIYHVAWMTLGNQITLNLLMAIMLDSFNTGEEEEEKDEDRARQKHLEKMRNLEGEELIIYFQESLGEEQQRRKKRTKKKQKKDDFLMDESFEVGDELNINSIKKKKIMFEGNYCELSAYLFTKHNPFRRFLYTISNSTWFETVIQITILLSSVKLVVDGYTKGMPEDSMFIRVSENMDLFFTVAFALESLIKALSLGLVMDKGSYLRESWSKLDFFIVISSLIDASFANIDIPVIKVLRLLRTLRPLRVISHNSDMKTVIVALIHSVAGIFYVAILLLMVWMMFAILAVNFFGGKLQMCSIDQYVNFTKEDCHSNGGIWYTTYFNYDDVLQALVSLFGVATTENWPDSRNMACDISGTETGPIRNNAVYYSYYFNAFILIGTYIFLNLLIGVIFIKFEEAQKEDRQSTMLDDKQFEWLDMLKMIVKSQPDLETTNVPSNRFRKFIHEFVTGINDRQKPGDRIPINIFETVIMTTIVLNMFLLCCNQENADPVYVKTLSFINYAFTTIFLIELFLKFIAFGSTYFQSTSNNFDFMIVIASLLDVTMDFLPVSIMKVIKVGPSLTKILRMLRVFRLFRLIKRYKGLNALVQTIIFSLPSLFNVFALFMLVYFIFAILGTYLFSDVTTGSVIDDITNFWNFGRSMLTLIRASTGEDWNNIMADLAQTNELGCIQGKTCGSNFATYYFIIFIFIQTFIMMNLYILVIVQQFQKYYLAKGNILEQFKEDLDKFKELWTFFSREFHCQKMNENKIIDFYSSMPKPLGMRGDQEEEIMKNIVMMDIQSDEGYYYFNEILFKTMKRYYCNTPIKNKLLAFQEYSAYQKVLEIKEQVKRKQREHVRKAIMTTNPFVLKMQVLLLVIFTNRYKHISFKLWYKKYKENLPRRQEEMAAHGNISDPEINPEAEQAEEYYYQTDVDESVSSDEEEDPQENESFLAANPLQQKHTSSYRRTSSFRMIESQKDKKDQLSRNTQYLKKKSSLGSSQSKKQNFLKRSGRKSIVITQERRNSFQMKRDLIIRNLADQKKDSLINDNLIIEESYTSSAGNPLNSSQRRLKHKRMSAPDVSQIHQQDAIKFEDQENGSGNQ